MCDNPFKTDIKFEWTRQPIDPATWHPLNGDDRYPGFRSKERSTVNWIANIGDTDFSFFQGTGHYFSYKPKNIRTAEINQVIKNMIDGKWSNIVLDGGGYGKMADFTKNKKGWDKNNRIKTPDDQALWECLQSDAQAGSHFTFEDFADEFGYDPDSRAAEKIYNECRETAAKLQRLGVLDKLLEHEFYG